MKSKEQPRLEQDFESMALEACESFRRQFELASRDSQVANLCASGPMSTEALAYWRRAAIAADRYLCGLDLDESTHNRLLRQTLNQACAQIDWSLPDNAVAVTMNRLHRLIGDEGQRLALWSEPATAERFTRRGSFPEFRRISMKPATPKRRDKRRAGIGRPAAQTR